MKKPACYPVLIICLALLLFACPPAAPDYEAQYRSLIDKFLEIYNTGNFNLVEKLRPEYGEFHPSSVGSSLGLLPVG